MVDSLFIEAARMPDQLKNKTSRSINVIQRGTRWARYPCHRADERSLPQSGQ
jgi:hypothetical protein